MGISRKTKRLRRVLQELARERDPSSFPFRSSSRNFTYKQKERELPERKEMISRAVLAVLAVLSGASAFVPSTMPFSACTRKPLSKVGVAVRWLAIPVA